MQLFDDFGVQCAKFHFPMEAGFLIRCVMAVATGQCRFDTIGNLQIEHIQDSWDRIKPGIEFAINFIRSSARVETIDVLPSPYAIIPLAVYAVNNGLKFGNEQTNLLRWFYAASMWGRYARGSSETILDQDLNSLKSNSPGADLIQNILRQTGRIKVEPQDLDGKGSNNSFFMMMYVLAMRNGAKDWGTGLPFSTTKLGKGHRIQLDHIFPQRKLTALLEAEGEKNVKALVNDMANIVFLSERENPRKAQRIPKEYLARIKSELGGEALTAQYIPLNEKVMGHGQV